MTKICSSVSSALIDIIKDNQTILIGGFGLCGLPINLVHHVNKLAVKNLTIISNDCSVENFGIGRLVEDQQGILINWGIYSPARMSCSWCRP